MIYGMTILRVDLIKDLVILFSRKVVAKEDANEDHQLSSITVLELKNRFL
jgi:hypothetical protein